jgi:uncharacterized protein (DUF433 family)
VERSEYVEQRNGGFYIAGTRVSLDSIVYSFKAGDSPETIGQNFSSLTLEQVYGAIESRPELYARLERIRHEMSTQHPAKH